MTSQVVVVILGSLIALVMITWSVCDAVVRAAQVKYQDRKLPTSPEPPNVDQSHPPAGGLD